MVACGGTRRLMSTPSSRVRRVCGGCDQGMWTGEGVMDGRGRARGRGAIATQAGLGVGVTELEKQVQSTRDRGLYEGRRWLVWQADVLTVTSGDACGVTRA